MPLIMLCGVPGSGKSFRGEEIKSKFLSQGHEVVLISDESLASKSEIYLNPMSEKNFRSLLKSTVERELTATKVVILDWMNYIKGFRYELFCLARNVQTTVSVVFLDTPIDLALTRAVGYSQELGRDLASRMETPNPKNRWDSPLFVLRPDEPTPFEDIERAVFTGKLPRPPVSTKQQEPVQGDYLYQLDQITQQVTEDVLETQETFDVGTEVQLPRTQLQYQIRRKVSALELKKARGQFIKMSRLRPCATDSIAAAFAEYIENSPGAAF